jgi:hypothetical protein
VQIFSGKEADKKRYKGEGSKQQATSSRQASQEKGSKQQATRNTQACHKGKERKENFRLRRLRIVHPATRRSGNILPCIFLFVTRSIVHSDFYFYFFTFF